MKKYLLIITAICITVNYSNCLASCTGSGCFSSGSCGTNCYYTLDDDGNLYISGENGIIRSGAFWDGWNRNQIKNVYIAEGIKEIGSTAFGYQGNLENVYIPDTVTTIGRSAFFGTGHLTSIVIPDSVTNIDNSAFNGSPINKIYCSSQQNTNGVCSESKINDYENSPTVENTVLVGTNDLNVVHYENEDGVFIVYDSFDNNGNILGAYETIADMQKDKVIDSYEKENEDSGRTDRYDGRGNLISSYAKNADGSIEIYDANGNLTGLKDAKYITPAQAAGLIKEKGNTVSITW